MSLKPQRIAATKATTAPTRQSDLANRRMEAQQVQGNAYDTRAVIDDDGVNLEVAERFVSLLGATRCTFQTFDDNAERKTPKLACILHGTLPEHAVRLIHLNRLGAGIFVAVNQTDGTGRKRDNIKRVRAVTADLDGAPLEPVRRCGLKPHVIVESSADRYHVYWLVKGLALDQFEDEQRAIAKRFDGDPEIAKLTHVARVPGFFHQKGKPFRTRIIEANNLPAYQAEDIIREFPPETNAHKPPVSISGRIILPAGNPVECAGEFLDKNFRSPDGVLCLYHYRGSFYRWVGTHYAEIDAKEVRSKLYGFLKDALTFVKKTLQPFNPTPNKVNAVMDALEMGVLCPREKTVPFWLEPLQDPSADGLIACRNGILDIQNRTLLPHDPHLFNVNCLPFDYDAAAPTYPPLWQDFLQQLWPGDQDGKLARLTLQEMFGLMLTPDTRYQKIFLIVGPKRSGKGTIAHVLTRMVGKDNVAGPTLSGLSSHFGLSQLIDKRAAIISDARLGPRTDAHTVAERLLSISGEDALTIDRKYRDPWTGCLGVRFLILTNELPRIADASGALASRFVVLTLSNSFYGKEDHELTDKLLTELPGILNWSLRGLERLRERRYFQMPQSSTDALRQLEDLASPISAFLRDWCIIDPQQMVNVKALYGAWKAWCEQQGQSARSSIVFGRDLRACVAQLSITGVGAKRRYVGVGLSEYGQQRYDLSTGGSL
jgi:putative DNA primase/helicase